MSLAIFYSSKIIKLRKLHCPVAYGQDCRTVCYDYYGFICQLLQIFQHLLFCSCVQCAGGFIQQQDGVSRGYPIPYVLKSSLVVNVNARRKIATASANISIIANV